VCILRVHGKRHLMRLPRVGIDSRKQSNSSVYHGSEDAWEICIQVIGWLLSSSVTGQCPTLSLMAANVCNNRSECKAPEQIGHQLIGGLI